MPIAVLCLLLGACASPSLVPGEPAPAAPAPAQAVRVEAPIRSVALFKNGYGYVRREALAPRGERAVELLLPLPTHGSFGVAIDPARGALRSAVARPGKALDTAYAPTLVEILRANLGREVELVVGDQTLAGRVLSAGAAPEERLPDPYGYSGFSPYPPGSEVILLATAKGSMALRGADVQRVSADGAPLEVRRSVPRARLEIGLDPKGEQEVPLTLTSLEHGWSWAPSYTIDLKGDLGNGDLGEGRAHLEARAVVFAEAGDLADATLYFVTGFPNLRYSRTNDPLALQGDFDHFLASLGLDDSPSVLGGQAVVQNARWDAPAHPELPADLAGQEAGDLFLFERRGVTLARGERGFYPLFQADVACEHVYQWTLPERGEPETSWINGREVTPVPVPEVWHALRLKNDSPQPWTTAPAATTKAGFLLGQDVLHYTAAGASTTVRITRAADVQGTATEFETGREPNVVIGERRYERISIEGRLKATNLERIPVKLEIEKVFAGLLATVPEGAERDVLAEPRADVNPRTRLRWSLTLQPGASQEVGYVYTFLRQ